MMLERVNSWLPILFLSCLAACSSNSIYTAMHETSYRPTMETWRHVYFQPRFSEPFIKGEQNVQTESRSRKYSGHQYDASNAATFAGSLIGHAIVENLLLEHDESKREKIAESTLGSLRSRLDITLEEKLTQAAINGLKDNLGIGVSAVSDESKVFPKIDSLPIFSISTTHSYIRLANQVGIYDRDSEEYFLREIEVYSDEVDTTALIGEPDEFKFNELLSDLYVISNKVALLDASGQLNSPDSTPKTYKISFGSYQEYHRAIPVTHDGNYTIMRTLDGNLLVV